MLYIVFELSSKYDGFVLIGLKDGQVSAQSVELMSMQWYTKDLNVVRKRVHVLGSHVSSSINRASAKCYLSTESNPWCVWHALAKFCCSRCKMVPSDTFRMYSSKNICHSQKVMLVCSLL